MDKTKIAKGVRVTCKGCVESGYFPPELARKHKHITEVERPGKADGYLSRSLLRYAEPFEGIIVGVSHRVTGWCDTWSFGKRGGPPKLLSAEKRHFVVMVQPTHTSRWLKPKACLLEDLELDDPNLLTLQTILERERSEVQDGYLHYLGDGKWSFAATYLQVYASELNDLMELAGIVPDRVESLGFCEQCKHSHDGKEGGWDRPCASCSRPKMTKWEPKESNA